MSNQNLPNITLHEYFNLLVGLITDDLKISNHLYHLGRSGADTNSFKFELHERIFTLAGLTKETNTEQIREWYYTEAEKANEFDIISDEKAFFKLSVEIYEGLMKARVH